MDALQQEITKAEEFLQLFHATEVKARKLFKEPDGLGFLGVQRHEVDNNYVAIAMSKLRPELIYKGIDVDIMVALTKLNSELV